MGRLRTPWTSQPQVAVGIDWNNPLTRGLVAVIDGRTKRNLISSAAPTTDLTIAGLGLAGCGESYTSAQYAIYSFNRSPITNKVTYFTLTDYVAAGAPNGFLFGDTEASAAGYNAGLYSNGSVFNFFIKAGGSSVAASGTTVSGGVTYKGLRHAGTYDGSTIRVYINGKQEGSAAQSGNVDSGAFSLNVNRWNSASVHSGILYLGLVFNRSLSGSEIKSLSNNPWQVLANDHHPGIPLASVVSIYRPSSDVTTTGWTGTPDNTDKYKNIDEVTASDTDYITSPTITGGESIIFGLSGSLVAGTWDVRYRANFAGASADVKITLLDGSNVSQGASSWQTVTSSYADYTASVTTTGTATRVKIEVQ